MEVEGSSYIIQEIPFILQMKIRELQKQDTFQRPRAAGRVWNSLLLAPNSTLPTLYHDGPVVTFRPQLDLSNLWEKCPRSLLK